MISKINEDGADIVYDHQCIIILLL